MLLLTLEKALVSLLHCQYAMYTDLQIAWFMHILSFLLHRAAAHSPKDSPPEFDLRIDHSIYKVQGL